MKFFGVFRLLFLPFVFLGGAKQIKRFDFFLAFLGERDRLSFLVFQPF